MGFQTDIHGLHNDILSSYMLCYGTTTTTNSSMSTGFLLHKNYKSYLQSTKKLFDGRLFKLQLKLSTLTYTFFSVYFPTDLENKSLDDPDYITTKQITDFLLHYRETHSNHTVVIMGDFNETLVCEDRGSGRQGRYGSRNLPLLIGENGFYDLSRSNNVFTYTGIVFGNHVSSKLDRILLSTPSHHSVDSYKVWDSTLFDTDHSLISYHLPTPVYKENSSFFKRKFYHPDNWTAEMRMRAWTEINSDMVRLNRIIGTTRAKRPVTSQDLDMWGAKFVCIIQDTLNFLPRKRFVRSKSYKTQCTNICNERRKHRRLKRTLMDMIRSSPTMTSTELTHLCTLCNQLFPSQLWCPESLLDLVPVLRVKITTLTQDLNKLLWENGVTQKQHLESGFTENRSKFYNRYLRGNLGKSSSITRIYDSLSNSVVEEPTDVKRVISQEAKKIFTPDTPEPTEPWMDQMYTPKLTDLDNEVWNPLIIPITTAEILSAVGVLKNKSPGPDGITKELLYFLCTCPKDSSITQDSSTATVLINFYNLWLTCEHCPRLFSAGLIIPIPKPGKPPEDKYEHKRPLTLLSEVLKTFHKILASRLQRILYENPAFLDIAQTAFLKEGSVDGPIRYLNDTILLHHGQGKNLYTISYDAAKAYDSIQFWHLHRALLSFGLPKCFCHYIQYYLQHATCTVSTAYGPSPPFTPQRGIKQGDPLSPLLYILTIDSLHRSLRQINMTEKLGISWRTSYRLFSDVSLGFADDTIIAADTITSIHKLHCLVVQYFDRHNLQLNIKKTQARQLVFTKESILLSSLDWRYQGQSVQWKDADVPFRYLGMNVRLDMDPSSHLSECERTRLYPYYRRLYYGPMTLEQCISAVREVIWPTLDFCTRFVTTPQTFVDKWDKLFLYVLKKKSKLCTSQVSHDGLMTILNLHRYHIHYPKAVLAEHTTFCNMQRTRWNYLSRYRMFSFSQFNIQDPLSLTWESFDPFSVVSRLFGKFKLRIERNFSYLGSLHDISIESISSSVDFLDSEFSLGMTYTNSRYKHCMTLPETSSISIWTDGSYKDDRMGWAVVVWDTHTSTWGVRRGTLDPTVYYGGQSAYVAELVAITVALRDFGSYRLTLYTDCQKFLSLCTRNKLWTEREKIRQLGRPLLRFILLYIKRNPAILLHYISLKSTIMGRERDGLVQADTHARLAREKDPLQIVNLSHLDYPLLLTHNTFPLIGDYRPLLHNILWKYQLTDWLKCTRQSLCIRYCRDTIQKRLEDARNLVGPRNRTSPWFIDTLLHNLPNQRMLSLGTEYEDCFFCHFYVPDDSHHFLTCPCLQHFFTTLRFSTSLTLKPQWSHHILPILLQDLSSIFDTSCELLTQTFPDIETLNIYGWVERYWLSLVIQRRIFKHTVFLEKCSFLGGQCPEDPEDALPMTHSQLTSIVTTLAHSLVVVIKPQYVPRVSRRWSTYGFVEKPDREWGQTQWYECNPSEHLLFGFVFSVPGRDFCSLERFCTNFCSTGGKVTIFTLFSLDSIAYKIPTNLTIQSLWNDICQAYIWVFTAQNSSLDQREDQGSNLVHFKLFPFLRESDNLWKVPFWGRGRTLLSLPTFSLPTEYQVQWEKFLHMVEYPFLLGIIPPEVTGFFFKDSSKISNLTSIFPRSWRTLKKIYEVRHSTYSDK